MRRRAARHEPHFSHVHGLGQFLRQPQMAEMDRIESAAENANRRD